jgi:predicted nucleotidyltransferase
MSRLLLSDLDELRRRIAPHVRLARKVIAFGSVARGEADAWSDLDLIVVADTARPFFERFKDFAGLYDVWPRLDLLVYTPEEFARMAAEDNPLIRRALDEGVVLHEAGES